MHITPHLTSPHLTSPHLASPTHAKEFIPDVLQGVRVRDVTGVDHQIHGAGLSTLGEMSDRISTVHCAHIGHHTHLEGTLCGGQRGLEPEGRTTTLVGGLGRVTHVVGVVRPASLQTGHDCGVDET
jgi:hypothetical protein